MLAASGRPLEANIVLPALALLSLLRMPIAFLPMIIMQLLNLKVAVGRITKFLMNEELSDEIKARSLEVEASFKEARAQGSPPIALSTAMGEILSETPDTGVAMSSVLRNAADGAAVALDLVSSAFSADVESEESVRIRTKAAPAAAKAEADTESEASSPSSKGGRGRGAAAAPPAAEEKATPPTLQRLSISFPRGELTMVA